MAGDRLEKALLSSVHHSCLIYFAKSFSSIRSTTMNQQGMEKDCITRVHFQMNSFLVRIESLDSMIHFIHTALDREFVIDAD